MILVILIVLVVGGVGGWRVGVHLTNKKREEENEFLRLYVEDLKVTISYWQNQAAYNKEIHNATIVNHNSNLSQTLNSIVTLLQNQNKENMKEGEKEKLETILKTIKGQ